MICQCYHKEEEKVNQCMGVLFYLFYTHIEAGQGRDALTVRKTKTQSTSFVRPNPPPQERGCLITFLVAFSLFTIICNIIKTKSM